MYNTNAREFIIKIAKAKKEDLRPVSPVNYKRMRRAALYSSGIGTEERMRLLKKSLEGRGKDKKETRDAGRVGAALGTAGGLTGGAYALGLMKPGQSLPKILSILGASALGGGVAGRAALRSPYERERKFAAKMSKNPDAIKALLQQKRRSGFFGRRRMRQEAALMREFASARKGVRSKGPFPINANNVTVSAK
tara:strand:- start:3847 stop:4428 length:582 start_codon:yes stop_codon:yes gene_type:complete